VFKHEAFKTLLPLYSLEGSRRVLSGMARPSRQEAWSRPTAVGRLDDQMFVCRAVGRSMETHDSGRGNTSCFRARPARTTRKIVLVQCRGPADPDTAVSYAVKRYSSKSGATTIDEWRQHPRDALTVKPGVFADSSWRSATPRPRPAGWGSSVRC